MSTVIIRIHLCEARISERSSRLFCFFGKRKKKQFVRQPNTDFKLQYTEDWHGYSDVGTFLLSMLSDLFISNQEIMDQLNNSEEFLLPYDKEVLLKLMFQ